MWLIVLVSLLIGAAGYAMFNYQEKEIRLHNESQLASIATLKANEIAHWLEEQKKAARALTDRTFLAQTLDELLRTGKTDNGFRKRILARLETIREIHNYRGLMLLDQKGTVNISTAYEGTRQDVVLLARAREAMNTRRVMLVDLHQDESGRAEIGLVAPLLSGEGPHIHVVGVLYFSIDPSLYLFPLIKSWPVNNKTAETLLVRRDNDQVVFLNDMRGSGRKALSLSMPIGQVEFPVRQALSGKTGFVTGKDYRDKQVVSYLLRVPGTEWAMVTKIDEDEIYASVRTLARYSIMAIFALIIFAILALVSYARRAEYAARSDRVNQENHALASRFNFLSKFANDMIFLMERDGRILDANDRAIEVYGYSLDEMREMRARDFRTVRAKEMYSIDWHVLQEIGSLVFETEHQSKDGRVFQVEASVRKLKTDDGKEYIQGILRDISERKLNETSMRRLSTAVDQSPVSVMIVSTKGKIEYVNARFTEVTGYTSEEAVGQNPRILKSGFHDRTFYQDLWSTILSGKTWRGELRNRVKSGELIWESASISPIFDDQWTIVSFVMVREDITARKETEWRLKRLNLLYKILSEANAVIIHIRKKDELLNAICRIAVDSGLFRMAWIGLLDPESGDVLPVAQAGHVGGYLDHIDINIYDSVRGSGPTGKAIREGQHVICMDIANDPYMRPWRDGALAHGYLASGVFPLFSETKIVGAVSLYFHEAGEISEDLIELLDSLSSDVSYALDFLAESARRKQAEDEIRKFNTELEKRVEERTFQLELANKELEAFSYSVSHDLRAPLRSIDGFSQILLKSYHDHLDAKGKDYLERVRRASQRMGELIDDMLHLSRVSRDAIAKESVDLSRMAQEIADELKAASPERRGEFLIEPGIIVHADARLSRIVLENLLGNAWKFTGKLPEALIRVGKTSRDGIPAIFVRDNGAGFNMEYAHKLFNPFQRLHGMNEFEGSGIGLATVQRIVRRHGGQAWAESKEGEGATFYFSCAQNDDDKERNNAQ